MTNKELITYLKSDLERIDPLDFRSLVFEQIIERLEGLGECDSEN